MNKGYLLDTQVLSWLEHDQSRLGKNTLKMVERGNLYYCSISVAELSFKRSLGKYDFSPQTTQGWQQAGISPLKFDDEAAVAFGRFSPKWTPDPFDRLIMAVTVAHNLVLLTSDSKILAQSFDWVFDATT
ncbi:MAG: type II toxin-antitoxin system VapC family toxin [Aquiluna sp.]|nr:type II toxin-antitoxin system VapC family toxin [Aquiluna sp.]MCF8545780.1 type II toxin-antitoxin system VapC family toxin [Aquiluna sp.]